MAISQCLVLQEEPSLKVLLIRPLGSHTCKILGAPKGKRWLKVRILVLERSVVTEMIVIQKGLLWRKRSAQKILIIN
jgi:hypothetical protein